METTLKLVPDSEQLDLSRVTKQALFYIPGGIEHKVISIDESQGAESAAYSIRELLSKKELKLQTPDGMLVVRGPVAYFETSAEDVPTEEQMSSRILEVYADCSVEQTRRIHDMQRFLATREGLTLCLQHEDIIARHHAAQRLLQPVRVEIPYAQNITFPATRVRTRRDHRKFLNLIRVIAFLHQYQRERGVTRNDEREVAYVSATLDDYESALNLLSPVLRQALDTLTFTQRELLNLVQSFVGQKIAGNGRKPTEVAFTRNDLCHFGGWTLKRVRDHLPSLVEEGYVEVLRGSRGKGYAYRLTDAALCGAGVIGLLSRAELEEQLEDAEAGKTKFHAWTVQV